MDNSVKLAVLSKIGQKLNDAEVIWAVGASLLLYFNKKTDVFHDIDIVIKVEDAPRVKNILLQMGTLAPPNPSGKYKTKCFLEFTVDKVDVDVIAGFVITHDGVDYDCALKSETINAFTDVNGVRIPLHSIDEWRRYYELMGRTDKVQMIDS